MTKISLIHQESVRRNRHFMKSLEMFRVPHFCLHDSVLWAGISPFMVGFKAPIFVGNVRNRISREQTGKRVTCLKFGNRIPGKVKSLIIRVQFQQLPRECSPKKFPKKSFLFSGHSETNRAITLTAFLWTVKPFSNPIPQFLMDLLRKIKSRLSACLRS